MQLEHLMQATKLLQLKKASLADIEIIFDGEFFSLSSRLVLSLTCLSVFLNSLLDVDSHPDSE